MVVDDEPDMVALIASQIESHGMVIAGTAASGDEALERWVGLRPDVIVLDYMMPGSNGIEVAAKILDADPAQNIVLFSAFITATTVAEARRVGIRQCVLKERLLDLPGILLKYCHHA